jgi:hypothetical protein
VQNVFVCGFWSMIDPIDGSEPVLNRQKTAQDIVRCYFAGSRFRRFEFPPSFWLAASGKAAGEPAER